MEKRYETMNEYIIRRSKIKTERRVYDHPIDAWIFFTIPIVNVIAWIIFLITYYNSRLLKGGDNENRRKERTNKRIQAEAFK